MQHLSSSLQGSEMSLQYPDWALAMIGMLILFATLPVPIAYIHSMLQNRRALNISSADGGGQEMHREMYTKCRSSDQLDSGSLRFPSEQDEAQPRIGFLPLGDDHYRLLPQQEDMEDDEEEDTGV